MEPPRRHSLLASIEHALGALVEIPAAMLVVAEIVILFAGVVARYGLHRAADLVGRTGVDPVPVAGDAGRRGRVPPRRAHADDGDRRQCAAGDARLSRPGRDLRGAGVPADDRLAGLRICLRGKLYHHAGAADPQQLARAALPVGIGLMALFALLRLARAGNVRALMLAAIVVGRAGHRGILAAEGLAAAARQSQPDHLLCRRGRLLRVRRRADRVRLWARDLRLSGADHEHAADGAGRPHGRGHEPPDPAVGAAVRVPRPADRDDRHGAGHGGIPGEPARAMSAAGCITCWSARCIWCQAFPARRPPTWRRSRPCCFRK